MKIAFWSNANEKCGVTENLAAISVASVIRYPYSVITIENRLCSNNLGKAFLGRSHVSMMNEVGTNYYEGGGMEGLIRKIYREDYFEGILKYYVKEIINKHLFYIPQSRIIHNEIFEYEFDHCVHPLLDILDEFADICFINTASNHNLSTKTILEESDLIVVNLSQSQSILEDFFLNYSSLINKAVFILSNYESNTKYNYKKIAHMYEIPLEDISIIPRNEFYQNSFAAGNVVEFISRNYVCPKENPNYLFIQAIKKSTYQIIKKAVELNRQKEISICSK